MLDGFVKTAAPNAVFLASYQRANLFRPDYKGDQWVGKSHESGVGGMVRHSFRWIQAECRQRGLVTEEIKKKELTFGRQTWLRIKADRGRTSVGGE